MNLLRNLKLTMEEVLESEIKVLYQEVNRKFAQNTLKEIRTITPWLKVSLGGETNLKSNHWYGYEITQEVQIKQFYEKVERIGIFLLAGMVINFDAFWENYFLQPATGYQTPTGEKTIFIISTYRLEKPRWIANLVLHEILEAIIREHCSDPFCILHPFQETPEFFFIENEKNFYEKLSEKLDRERGICKIHKNLIEKYLRLRG